MRKLLYYDCLKTQSNIIVPYIKKKQHFIYTYVKNSQTMFFGTGLVHINLYKVSFIFSCCYMMIKYKLIDVKKLTTMH